ncbi:hypothetical protein PLICRDRAFT_171614 [Plicaturopsis crispa FD-325 SS-3]|nr:hypothetical protein PLICRDRAFT_171614 [Plicaturopsis crispa FD-325 SS-3]
MNVDISPFLSERSRSWEPSAIRGLFPLEHIPGMISLLAGKPNPSTFPFESITMKLKPHRPPKSCESLDGANVNGNMVGESGDTITLDNEELDEALQYGATAGLKRLIEWLQRFQSEVHGRTHAGEGWDITIGCGSQDLMYKAFQVLINDGDSILVETPAYAGTLGFLTTEPCHLVEVESDSDGLDPASLDYILSSWSATHPYQRFPKLLYTIPTGSNPSGASIPESRKIEILKLAKRYDLLIMEDDAYAFLYYGPQGRKARSYFSLEKEINGEMGRVVRFDSFSKVLSSGIRLGFMTAPAAVCHAVNLITMNTNLQAPSTTQVMVHALLEHWGISGFLDHCERVADFYRVQRDIFELAARRHLQGIAEWVTPVAGMFLYMRLLFDGHASRCDSFTLIREKAVAKGVLAVPGVAFMPSGSATAYVRVSFSLVNEQQADEACRRLRAVVIEARNDIIAGR